MPTLGTERLEHDVPIALSQFGVTSNISVTDLPGGTINRAYLVHAPKGRLVLKAFRGGMNQERLSLICAAQMLAADRGQPVPKLTCTASGDPFALVRGTYFTLTDFVEGRTYPDGAMPPAAAASLGATLAELHEVLGLLPPAVPSILFDRSVFRATVAQLVPLIPDGSLETEHRALLESKLAELDNLPKVDRELACQWLHGDYSWRNVIFDDRDQVVGIIDFDNLRFMPRAYDVMRCFTFGFQKGAPEADRFFLSYARATHLTAADVKAWVEHWWWVLTFRLWPLDARYTQLDYEPSWDPAIDSLWPPGTEYWHGLIDRLSAIVENPAGPRGGSRRPSSRGSRSRPATPC